MSKFAVFEHIRISAEASKNFVMGLIGEVAGTVADALEELHSLKSDKTAAVSITIPISGWSSDNTADYPQYYDIAVAGVTVRDRAEITIEAGSLGAAIDCGLCQTNETLAGKIRVRSISIPAVAIQAEYWLEKGKESE